MLLQIFRIYLSSAKDERNWLIALSDAKLSKAIEAVHSDQMDWSLEKLAEVAGMSRSVRFEFQRLLDQLENADCL
jgi:hypothetical protein